MRPAGAVEGDGVLYARARRGDVADLQVREKPHQRIGIADRRVRDVGPPDPGQLQRLAAARAERPCVPALVVPLERDVRAVPPPPEEPPFSSEERRVGKEWVSTFRSRWDAYH